MKANEMKRFPKRQPQKSLTTQLEEINEKI